MSLYIYIPSWFKGIDSVLEIFIIIVFFLISLWTYRVYKYFNRINYKYFSLSFLIFSFAFMLKIFSNLIFIYPKTNVLKGPFFTIVYVNYYHISFLEPLLIFLYKFFILLGLLILYFLTIKRVKIEEILLNVLFVLIISYEVKHYLIFNLMAFFFSFFLFLIILNKSSKILKIFYLGFSFFYLFIALSIFNNLFYIIAELLLLFSTLIIFFEIYKIKGIKKKLKNEKKKR